MPPNKGYTMSTIKKDLLEQYPHLKSVGRDTGAKRDVALNIRKHLKHSIPSSKFSVRVVDTGIKVSWVDGASQKTVREVTDLFINQVKDMHDDGWDSAHTDFTNTFGGVKLIMLDRSYSDELIESVMCKLADNDFTKHPMLTIENYHSGVLLEHFPENSDESYIELIRQELNTNFA